MTKLLVFCVLLSISGLSFANCSDTEKNGDHRSNLITQAFNNEFGGFSKNFYVGEFKVVKALGVNFSGCKGIIKMKVKLGRPWPFKDARGIVKLKGRVSLLSSTRICLKRASIVDISLSNTSPVEERLYRGIANPFMGLLSRCYKLPSR